MKKHPVDDLFKKRLASFEKKPSELTWKRIQEGQKTKSRRTAVWVWYAAASVVLTLATGYLVWQGQKEITVPGSSKPEMAYVEKTIPKTELYRDSIPGTDEKRLDDNVSSPRKVEKPSVAKQGVSKEVPSYTAGPELSNKNDRTKPAAMDQIAKIEPVKAQDVKPETTQFTQPIPVDRVITKTAELAQHEEKKPDRTIIVEVDEPAGEMKDKSKSRLSRVFRQLKNMREAEPVDWDDVGFNPKSIIARADDRTDHDQNSSGKRERKN